MKILFWEPSLNNPYFVNLPSRQLGILDVFLSLTRACVKLQRDKPWYVGLRYVKSLGRWFLKFNFVVF